MPLQITTRTPEVSDFKFELLPLHSPLLRQSLLVSFPPLIDMLKFSGYSYLIRGQTFRSWGLTAWPSRAPVRGFKSYYAEEAAAGPPLNLGGGDPRRGGCRSPTPGPRGGLRVEMTLEQACPPGCRRAPGSGAEALRPAPGASRRSNVLVRFTWGLGVVNSVMIPPLVHQRRPCYDFYFL